MPTLLVNPTLNALQAMQLDESRAQTVWLPGQRPVAGLYAVIPTPSTEKEGGAFVKDVLPPTQDTYALPVQQVEQVAGTTLLTATVNGAVEYLGI